MTTTNRPAKTLDHFTGAYGPNWETGVITEHLYSALEAGMVLHRTATGRLFLTGPGGGVAVPVVCSELIPMFNEDGLGSGRCGAPAIEVEIEGQTVALACAGHTEEILSWKGETR